MVSLTSASLLVHAASGNGGPPSELEGVPAAGTQGRSRRPPLTPPLKRMWSGCLVSGGEGGDRMPEGHAGPRSLNLGGKRCHPGDRLWWII